jgi:hypothetical protein
MITMIIFGGNIIKIRVIPQSNKITVQTTDERANRNIKYD